MTEQQRAARAAAAGREVAKTATATERTLLRQMLKRLEQLRTELLAVLTRRTISPFRQYTAASLLTEVDALIANAKADVLRLARSAYQDGVRLGTAAVDQAIRAAAVHIVGSASLDSRLVTHAFDNTVDLLSEAMQQFRNKAALQVRRIALEGEPTFTAIKTLGKQIAGQGFDSAMFRAERIVRTELSRTLNTSSYERMVELSEEAPFLRKEWRATADSRTRETHVQAQADYGRGKGILIADLFTVGKGLLKHPSDPNGPAEEVIMCRCSLRTAFDLKDLKSFTVARLQTVVPRRAA